MTFVLYGLALLALAGPIAVATLIPAAAGYFAWRRRSGSSRIAPRLVMVVLLVHLRSGRSVLSALTETAKTIGDPRLSRLARLASVTGLTAAIPHCPEDLRTLVSQLARAQTSGAALSDTVRTLIERDIAAERAVRLARARSLPVRLMIPITLAMMPGMVLLLYAPSLLALFRDLSGTWP